MRPLLHSITGRPTDTAVARLFHSLRLLARRFIRRRLLPPLDLVALGSYNEEANIEGKFETESMQSARFESGLDNSPM